MEAREVLRGRLHTFTETKSSLAFGHGKCLPQSYLPPLSHKGPECHSAAVIGKLLTSNHISTFEVRTNMFFFSLRIHMAERKGFSMKCVTKHLIPQLQCILQIARYPRLLSQAYAMTEASHQMTSNPLPKNGPHKPGTVGRAQGTVRVAVLDDNNRPVAEGTIGEVCLQGPNVTKGYLNNPKANQEGFAGTPGPPESIKPMSYSGHVGMRESFPSSAKEYSFLLLSLEGQKWKVGALNWPRSDVFSPTQVASAAYTGTLKNSGFAGQGISDPWIWLARMPSEVPV